VKNVGKRPEFDSHRRLRYVKPIGGAEMSITVNSGAFYSLASGVRKGLHETPFWLGCDALLCDRHLVFCIAAHCRALGQDYDEVFPNPSECSERHDRATVRNHCGKLS
jgi:hypothetical protein